jgi:hypothetical protein
MSPGLGSILTCLGRRLNRDRKTPHVIRLDANKQSVARIRAEKGKFRAFGAAAARADLGMSWLSQRNQTVCYETVQRRPKMGVC